MGSVSMMGPEDSRGGASQLASPADPARRIADQGLDGGSGLPEEEAVDEALVGAGQGAEFGRESERR